MPNDKNKGNEQNEKKYVLKNDKFRRMRGGSAKLIDIICTKCSATVLLYQKDGSGFLHRCYLNRIFEPPKYSSLQYNPAINDLKDVPNLVCPDCNTVLSTAMRHFDGRLAYRLRPFCYTKKQSNAKYE